MVLWFLDTPSVGSLVVFAVGLSVFIAYFRMLRWIQSTPPDKPRGDEAAVPDVKK